MHCGKRTLRIFGLGPVQQEAQIVQERGVAEEVALDEVVEVARVREALHKLQLPNETGICRTGLLLLLCRVHIGRRLWGSPLSTLPCFVVVRRQFPRSRR
jgi:hypothetical protein